MKLVREYEGESMYQIFNSKSINSFRRIPTESTYLKSSLKKVNEILNHHRHCQNSIFCGPINFRVEIKQTLGVDIISSWDLQSYPSRKQKQSILDGVSHPQDLVILDAFSNGFLANYPMIIADSNTESLLYLDGSYANRPTILVLIPRSNMQPKYSLSIR